MHSNREDETWYEVKGLFHKDFAIFSPHFSNIYFLLNAKFIQLHFLLSTKLLLLHAYSLMMTKHIIFNRKKVEVFKSFSLETSILC